MHEIGIEWMTQTEVNGHFLELRGIPDEKLEWERIPALPAQSDRASQYFPHPEN